MAGVTATTEYRGVPGHPGYRVGDDGSVWTCLRKTYSKGHIGIIWVRGDTWSEMGYSKHRDGHLRVVLRLQGNSRYLQVHRLVLETFVGPCPEGYQACHFPDRNPANNALSNLRWDTQAANQADRVVHGTDLRGEQVKSSKLTAAAVVSIRREYAEGGTTTYELAAKYGVSRPAIGYLLARKTWAHVE